MCGIFGYYSSSKEFEKEKLKIALNKIDHRGPDEDDLIFPSKNEAIGFKRLSIVDSKNKTMPFIHQDTISTFNGELYNYELIKNKYFKDFFFKTNNDGEIIIPLLKNFQYEKFSEINGMYAIAIHDPSNIILLRDQYGQKPLYYYKDENTFIYASEINPIIELLGKKEINETSISTYLLFGYIPSPETIFKNIYKLEPNTILTFNKKLFKIDKRTLENKVLKNSEYGSYKLIKKTFREKLINSINLRFNGDFPALFAMSGGLDSTSLSLIASKILNKNIETFTIHNDFKYLSNEQNNKFNEDSHFASKIASEYNINNHKIIINEKVISEVLEDSFNSLEEPSYSFQSISLYSLFKNVSKNSKILITGDGADEILGGYNFIFLDKYYGFYSLVPKFIRNFLKKYSDSLNNEKISNFFAKGVQLDLYNRYLLWHSVFSKNDLQSLTKLLPIENSTYFQNTLRNQSKINLSNELIIIEFDLWLRDHYCIYVDKLSMHNSLELRFPFLDQDLVRYTKSLPLDYKSSKNNRKKLLKDSFNDIFPNYLIERKKLGLLPPASMWLRKDLKEDMLSSIKKMQANTSYFNNNYINTIISNHLDYKEYNLPKIWSLYSLAKFFEKL